jgi:ABC-type Zn uptake system ZnuABC Zn-binding protein ZnuA
MKMLFLSASGDHPIEGTKMKAGSLFPKKATSLASGGKLTEGTLFSLQFDSKSDMTVFDVEIDKKGTYVFYAEHMPYEFEADEHFFKTAKGADVEPIAEEPEGGHDHHHHHGDVDPHIWLDPIKAIAAVHEIEEALVAVDPANAASYEARAEAYIAELKELDAWITTKVATVPEDHRILVTGHDAYGHFADRYGFKVGATILGLSTEAADPSPKHLNALIERVKEAGVPAVFGEVGANNRLMQTLAREVGVTLGKDLQPGFLGPKGSGLETYIGLMKANVEIIVEGLAP